MGHTMNTIGCMGFAQLVYMFVDFDRSFDHILLGLGGGGCFSIGYQACCQGNLVPIQPEGQHGAIKCPTHFSHCPLMAVNQFYQPFVHFTLKYIWLCTPQGVLLSACGNCEDCSKLSCIVSNGGGCEKTKTRIFTSKGFNHGYNNVNCCCEC